MNVEIQLRNAGRVREAIRLRRRLMEMPSDYEYQLDNVNYVIAAAVSSAYERTHLPKSWIWL